MAKTIDLVREVDGYKQTLTIDIFDFKGWKVRVKAYDGKSPMPAMFELLPGGKTEKATAPIFETTVKEMRAEGWLDELAPDAKARIAKRVAAANNVAENRENDLAERLKAFPVSGRDKLLAEAIANPAKVRELDLRAKGKDRLTVIPPTIKKLVALEILRADGNGLVNLPEEISRCKALREIHLADNAIRRISPLTIKALKALAVLDLQRNQLERIYARASVPMRLEIAGNPLEDAEADKLTRSTIGDFRKLSHVGIDTDRLFPIDFDYFEVDYPKVKALPTESIALYGRKPTKEELASLAKLLPKAKVDYRGPSSAA